MRRARSLDSPQRGAGLNLFTLLFILALVVAALISASPYAFKVPGTDSGIFLYIGGRIHAGQLPYLDAYDHKPPLIFYLNALGLALGSGSRWGVWAIEVISLALSSLLCFSFLKRFFGRGIALLSTAAMLLNLSFVLEHGNLTEEYALPFLFAALALTAEMEARKRAGWMPFWIGAALGMASTLKQPLAGLGLAIVVYLAVTRLSRRDIRGLVTALALILAGGLAVWAGWALYFTAAGIFPQFWEGAFAYNFALSSITPAQRLVGVTNALIWTFTWPNLFLAGLLFWLTLPVYLVLHDRRFRSLIVGRWMGGALAVLGLLLALSVSFVAGILLLAAALPFLLGWVERKGFPYLEKRKIAQNSSLWLPLMIAVVDFPVAFLLPNLSGNSYPHYFMALLPSATILAAYVCHLALGAAKTRAQRARAALWLAALCLPVLGWGILNTRDLVGPNTNADALQAAEAIQAHSQPGESVLDWGNTPSIYLLSGRLAPTRFFFADPLFVGGYTGSAQTAVLLADLNARPPALILDERLPYRPLVLTKDPAQCGRLDDLAYVRQAASQRWLDELGDAKLIGPAAALPQIPDGMQAVYRWICERYEPVQSVGVSRWTLYRMRR